MTNWVQGDLAHSYRAQVPRALDIWWVKYVEINVHTWKPCFVERPNFQDVIQSPVIWKDGLGTLAMDGSLEPHSKLIERCFPAVYRDSKCPSFSCRHSFSRCHAPLAVISPLAIISPLAVIHQT